MAKIIELSERLAGRAEAAKLTLRERLDKEKKTRTQVIELLETAYSKYLTLGENYKQLADQYKNIQRVATMLTMHAASVKLDENDQIATDEISVTVDQAVGELLAGARWDFTVDPTEDGQVVIRLRRHLVATAAEG